MRCIHSIRRCIHICSEGTACHCMHPPYAGQLHEHHQLMTLSGIGFSHEYCSAVVPPQHWDHCYHYHIAVHAARGTPFSGLQGVMYASRSSKDAPSTVMYRPFDSWAANSDWQVSLPTGDEALAVTAGQSFSAVATSQHMLRVFSPAGASLPLLALVCAVLTVRATLGTSTALRQMPGHSLPLLAWMCALLIMRSIGHLRSCCARRLCMQCETVTHPE